MSAITCVAAGRIAERDSTLSLIHTVRGADHVIREP